MSAYFNRRAFISLFMVLVTGGPILLSGSGRSHAADHAAAQVIVWGGPGGEVAASPDYEVTVRSGGKVSAQNCRDYFEILKGVTVGKEIVFE